MEDEKIVKEVQRPPEEITIQGKSQSAKYPKRENRKPPAHLAEAFGPALFSAPDIIRRISTCEDVPQTPPEKKNFTVGAHSSAKSTDRGGNQVISNKTENMVRDSASQLKPKSKLPMKEPPKPVKVIKNENLEMQGKEKSELREENFPSHKLTSGVIGERHV